MPSSASYIAADNCRPWWSSRSTADCCNYQVWHRISHLRNHPWNTSYTSLWTVTQVPYQLLSMQCSFHLDSVPCTISWRIAGLAYSPLADLCDLSRNSWTSQRKYHRTLGWTGEEECTWTDSRRSGLCPVCPRRMFFLCITTSFGWTFAPISVSTQPIIAWRAGFVNPTV